MPKFHVQFLVGQYNIHHYEEFEDIEEAKRKIFGRLNELKSTTDMWEVGDTIMDPMAICAIAIKPHQEKENADTQEEA